MYVLLNFLMQPTHDCDFESPGDEIKVPTSDYKQSLQSLMRLKGVLGDGGGMGSYPQ